MNTQVARLVRKTELSPDTSDFCFEILGGRFTGLEPGAHVDVHLTEDLVRQYSLVELESGRPHDQRGCQTRG